MTRPHLSEDIRQIQKYFPGAQTVSLHTPFDLTNKPRPHQTSPIDTFRDDEPETHWYSDLGGLSWSR